MHTCTLFNTPPRMLFIVHRNAEKEKEVIYPSNEFDHNVSMHTKHTS